MNKDLILRENLAIERTHLANQTTLLSFLRTSMYFFVAGLTIYQLLDFDSKVWVSFGMYTFSVILFVFGIYNFFKQRRWILQQKKHVGDYKLAYEAQTK
ncbi:MAG TPA: DUF202 domain-containing protein [Flavobacterium sp.]|nr:DUF202 domain-containing protein [Flavobacterium sp.]